MGQTATFLQTDSNVVFSICAWRIVYVFPQTLVLMAHPVREPAGGGAGALAVARTPGRCSVLSLRPPCCPLTPTGLSFLKFSGID